ncbi:MAG: PilZ domain-containing protein [Kofleriaceae bacterium]|nr:PilZ domain-containing protein [Kofleriaceae bacterium]
MATPSSRDRRRALRAPVHGTAILHDDRGVIRGIVENLSLFGVSVLANAAPPAGETLDVELALEARPRLWLLGHLVRVVRRDIAAPGPGAMRIAIDFERVPAAVEEILEDEVVAAYTASQERPVVIVDGAEGRRAALAEAVRARGMTPLVPRTPLEVIDLLSRRHPHADVCMVSSGFGGVEGRALVSFLTETFPWVRITTVRTDPDDAAEQARAAWREVDETGWR